MPTGSIRIAVTPAERQQLGRLAQTYGCDVDQLGRVAVEELLKAHRTPRRLTRVPKARRPRRAVLAVRAVAQKPQPEQPQPQRHAGRTYAEKPCARCEVPFTPSGPRAKYCFRCQKGGPALCAAPVQDDGMEVVWNGTQGRQGASLRG